MLGFSRSAVDTADEARRAGYADIAVTHEDVGRMYQQRAFELVGLDKLSAKKDKDDSELKRLRDVVKNLSLYKK